ncbi:carnitine O-acetyltransferase, putative [Bodo saltans]|uniref:Carnitine O-acetyltransferase, putative n=1 Tax=Bodo saltans TaxID=75058 RepID=A0A0S4JAG1_BODSA|nr:carnitine O-acetyltransferase, putative [Bodo saltans]|eukprot:CUG87199.1 carnitine O-acetyltransferase, putative [Bodo saltans]
MSTVPEWADLPPREAKSFRRKRHQQNIPLLHNDGTVISAFGRTFSALTAEERTLLHQAASLPREHHQAKIPRLPVPALADTCKLYLSSLEGLVNAEEYAATQERVRELLAPGGDGERLQRLLEEREARQEQPSWLEEWWDDAYLVTRDPIPINVNYFFGFQPHPDHARSTQVGRAASLLHAALDFYVQVRDGTLTNDMERTTPLCMSQMRRVFCASRVPGAERDTIVSYSAAPLTADERASKTCQYVAASPAHCMVLVRNRYYKLRVLEGTGVLPVELLAAALARIVDAATNEKAAPGPPVGVLTTMHRTEWFEARAQLLELGNEDVLQSLQSAILVVCLDGMAVSDTAEAARLFLHGTGTNRWFDRHNLIVARNAAAGINFEHSVGDGATTLRVADYMYRQDARRVPLDVAACVAQYGAGAAELVTELQWSLDSQVDRTLKDAFDGFLELIESNETTVLHFRHYGGNMIKSAKISPDAYLQLAFQLTYYRLFGRNDATYEAASTRAFLHGRTETVRSVTRAAADFCRSASDPLFSRRVGSVIPDQLQLLKNGAQAHVDYMKFAKNGTGVDRHFYGLRMLAKSHGKPMPSIFLDPIFERSCHWNMSTSHCGSTALNLFGFGPVVSDGFGLGYMIFNKEINVVITSKYTHRLTSSSIFSQMLEGSLLQMRCILESAPENRQKEDGRRVLEFTHPTAYNDFSYEATRGFTYRSTNRRSLYQSNSGTGSGVMY